MSGAKARLRKIVRWTAIHGLWATGVLRFLRGRLAKENAILVLMMHRVLSEAQKSRTNSEPAMIVGDQAYRDMVTHVLRHYRVVDLTRRVPEFSGDRPGIGLTFDDGWLDNFEPILGDLQQRGVPATIFISPGLAGQENPFWPERVRELLAGRSESELRHVVETMKRMEPVDRKARIQQMAAERGSQQAEGTSVDRTMTWAQIESLRTAGITFGSHTQNHEILTSLSSTELVDRELREAKQDIENHFGETCEVLAYPNGSHSDDVVDRSMATGYRRAFTVKPGAWTPETHPLRIPRLNVSDDRVCFGGKFSAAAFEFAVVWRAYRALLRERAAGRTASAAQTPSPSSAPVAAAAAAPERQPAASS
jgi:peptidoglycan/xylan/chitin deacetylase (PgdA/CDA1 family)